MERTRGFLSCNLPVWAGFSKSHLPIQRVWRYRTCPLFPRAAFAAFEDTLPRLPDRLCPVPRKQGSRTRVRPRADDVPRPSPAHSSCLYEDGRHEAEQPWQKGPEEGIQMHSARRQKRDNGAKDSFRGRHLHDRLHRKGVPEDYFLAPSQADRRPRFGQGYEAFFHTHIMHSRRNMRA